MEPRLGQHTRNHSEEMSSTLSEEDLADNTERQEPQSRYYSLHLANGHALPENLT